MKRHGRAGYAAVAAFVALTLSALACAGSAASPAPVPTAAPTVTVAGPAATDTPASEADATAALSATTTPAPTVAPATLAPRATATQSAPSGLVISSVTSYEDNNASYQVVGLVVNDTNQAVGNVTLALMLTDGSGNSVLKDLAGNPTDAFIGTTLLATIGSGGSAPFAFVVDPGGFSVFDLRPRVTVASSEPVENPIREAVDAVNSQVTTDPYGDLWLTSQLTNHSSTETVTAGMAAGLYGADGKVLDASQDGIPFELVPGATSPGFLDAFPNVNSSADLVNKVVSYTAQIDASQTFTVAQGVASLQPTNVTRVTNAGQAVIKGDIVNTTGQTLDNPQVIVLANNTDGKIVAGDWNGADGGKLRPGAKVGFEVDLDLPGKTKLTGLAYEVQAQAKVSQ